MLPTNNPVSAFRYYSLCDFNDCHFDLLHITSEFDELGSAPNIFGGGDRNFAIFISFHFENENRPLMQVWRLQNANAGLAVPAPNQAPQANAGAAGQVNAGAQAGQAGGA